MVEAHISLVTGSARGLGLAVAKHMAARGDRVHVVWRSSEASSRELEQLFPGRVHRADLSRAEDAARLVSEIKRVDGGLDCVVHAVGEYQASSLERTSAQELRQLWSSNVETAQHLMQEVRPLLRQGLGRLVLFGCAGLAGLRARRDAAGYTAAKSALLVLARSWAVEEAPFGVTVNMVSPGLVPHAAASEDTKDPDMQAKIPAGRVGTVEEVAAAVAWLCSEASSYTSGSDIILSGAWKL